MRKKILSIFVIIVMMLSGSACSENNSDVSVYSENTDYNSVSDCNLIEIENKYTGYIWDCGDFSNILTYGIPSEKSKIGRAHV